MQKKEGCLETDFTPFLSMKSRQKKIFLAAIKFILFCDTLILRFVDSSHSASEIASTYRMVRRKR